MQQQINSTLKFQHHPGNAVTSIIDSKKKAKIKSSVKKILPYTLKSKELLQFLSLFSIPTISTLLQWADQLNQQTLNY